ncbi:hypothetical protein C3747_146g28 [Trypanosoma cruzi]|uniref:Uncharacterized protein n=2 Tax=Trypanosoma cruzi TaxID=5693 RepID=A0A2V2W931_TRYCR|nr:hypothetical protein C3747_146g28 [Trypanosoma cruzi]
MMDVDDVIARHRARLDEHRKFLHTSPAGSTKPPKSPDGINSSGILKTVTRFHAVGDNTFSPLPAWPGSEASFDVSPQPDINSLKPGRDKKGRVKSGPGKKLLHEPKTLMGSADVTPEKLKAQAASFSGRAELRGGRALEAAPRRASSGPVLLLSSDNNNNNNNNNRNRKLQDWLAEEERFFDSQLKAVGRYYVTKPEAMYAKSQLWLESRERSLQRLQEESQRDVLGECSFQPNVAGSRSLTRRSSSNHAISSFCEDPSVAAHLERMEEARQLRVEAEKRVKGKKAGTWTNSITVPREFEFAKKVAVIPSLRKPLVNVVPLHDDDEVKEEGARPRTDGNCAGAACGDLLVDTKTVATQRKRHGGEEEEEEGRKKEEAKVWDASLRGAKAVSQLKVVPLLEATIVQLKEELARKDEQLQAQKGELALLSRELEVAKATVRRLSLQDVVKVEEGEEERGTTPGPTSPMDCQESTESNT